MISTNTGGEGGIRTPDTVSPVRRIQLQNSCASRDANCGHEIKLTESLAARPLHCSKRLEGASKSKCAEICRDSRQDRSGEIGTSGDCAKPAVCLPGSAMWSGGS